MTSSEAQEILRRLDRRALEQVAMLQRIAGYLHVIEWAVGFSAFMLLLLVLERAK